ncbi:MAG: hypothetical protein LBC44_02975, partial [Mycoplasmataceae bacterium]|nr:hypothetical protein [Mycoplasmataceae bacterium]
MDKIYFEKDEICFCFKQVFKTKNWSYLIDIKQLRFTLKALGLCMGKSWASAANSATSRGRINSSSCSRVSRSNKVDWMGA